MTASGTQADLLLDRGDTEGAAVWRRIVEAIKLLQADAPPDGVRH